MSSGGERPKDGDPRNEQPTMRFIVLAAAGFLLLPVLLKGASAETRAQSAGVVFVAPPSSAGLSTNGNDSDGSNCTRFFAGTTAPPGGVGYGCATFQKAYQVAQPGDIVYLNWNGAWTGNQRIGPSGNKSSGSPCSSPTARSGCVDFAPGPGLTPSITGGATICGDYVELSGVVFNQSTAADSSGTTVSNGAWKIGAADNSCLPSGAPPHDILIENVTAHGWTSIIGGAFNVYVHGGSIGNSYNLPAQLGGAGNNGQTPGVHNSVIDGVTFHDFVSTNTQRYHMECLHMDFAGSSNVVRNSRFLGCPIYSVRVEAEGDPFKNAATQTNHLFENNVFDGQQLNFDCHDNGCVVTGNVVRFNTFVHAGFTPTSDCGLSSARTCSVSGNTFYGNVIGGGCPPASRAFALGWTSMYNIFTGSGGSGSVCAADQTSAFNRTVSLRSPGPPNYDERLANCSQLAASFVPPDVKGGVPKTDAEGELLPSRGLAGAGADQCDTSAMVLGRSIGAVAIGQSGTDIDSRYGRPRAVRTLAIGRNRLRRLLYRVHRGDLWVYEDARGRAVGIGTTSPYYTTAAGLGVGAPIAGAADRLRLTWLDCRSAYTRQVGSAAVYVIPRGGKRGSMIASISMLSRRYALCPPK